MDLSQLTIPAPPEGPADWNSDGFVIKKKFLPEELMAAYEECWVRCNGEMIDGELVMHSPGGWGYCTPYRDHKEVRDLFTYKGINDTIEELIGEPAGVHLNLTGWISTTRNWHQDTYLNPAHVGDHYAAVWIALDTINPDSGPFQFVRGSHRWPVVTQEKILKALPPHERDHRWPRFSESLLTPLFTEEIEKRGAEVITYLPERGDVLFWHGRLLHRGSIANKPGTIRKSAIAHYSGINHRQDMPKAQKYGDGWVFPIDDPHKK